MKHSIRTFIRIYARVTYHNSPLRIQYEWPITDTSATNIAHMHKLIASDKNFCAYDTYQISVLTDENGLEHRSAPINESRMVKFGEIKRAEDAEVIIHTGYMPTAAKYADEHPEARNRMVVICGNNISILEPNDIVHDIKTGKRIWPIDTPRPPAPRAAP